MPDRSAGLRDDAERRNDELPELAEVANFAQLRLAAAVHSPGNIIEISPVCPGSYAFAFKKIKINARINSELALGTCGPGFESLCLHNFFLPRLLGHSPRTSAFLSISSFFSLSLLTSLYLFFSVQLVKSAQFLFPSFSLCKLYRGNT